VEHKTAFKGDHHLTSVPA